LFLGACRRRAIPPSEVEGNRRFRPVSGVRREAQAVSFLTADFGMSGLEHEVRARTDLKSIQGFRDFGKAGGWHAAC